MAWITAAILLGLVLFYRPLLVCSFDPQLAASLGIRVALVNYALMAALSLTIVSSFEAVGAILAVALLITSGATARLWTTRMSAMLAVAAAHGLASTALGYALSHHSVLDTSAGGAITLAGFGLFLLSWVISPRQGLIGRWVVSRLVGNVRPGMRRKAATKGVDPQRKKPTKLQVNDLQMPPAPSKPLHSRA